jgi:hypothetical protein
MYINTLEKIFFSVRVFSEKTFFAVYTMFTCSRVHDVHGFHGKKAKKSKERDLPGNAKKKFLKTLFIFFFIHGNSYL